MYFSRGIPTVYYGDEVGMTGSGNGGDQRARQSMFETKILAWKSEPRVGSNPVGDGNSFTGAATHPIALHLAELAKLRATYPALANGEMQVRLAKGSTLVLSKYDLKEKIEYLVAFNTGNKTSQVSVTSSSNARWKTLLGSPTVTNKGSKVNLTIPAFDSVVLQSTSVMPPAKIVASPLKIRKDFLTGMLEISAPLKSSGLSRVEFSVKSVGSSQWKSVGTDFNTPYRIYLSPTDYPAGSKIEIKATALNIKGDRVAFKQIETVNR
jgi:hypothetical protein